MDQKFDWLQSAMAYGPLGLMFGTWLWLCVSYLPGVVAAHLKLVAACERSLWRLADAFESLSKGKSHEPLELPGIRSPPDCDA